MEEANPKQDAINSLTALKQEAGWKLIVGSIEEEIKEIELKLHGVMELDKDETLELLQTEWRIKNQLKAYPDHLVEEYKVKPEAMTSTGSLPTE